MKEKESSVKALVYLRGHFPNTNLHYSSWQETTCGLFSFYSKDSLAYTALFAPSLLNNNKKMPGKV